MATEKTASLAEGSYIGVDLGTSNTVVSFYKKGSFEQVEFKRKKIIPSALYFKSPDIVLFGDNALKKGVSDPVHLISEFKRDLGSDKKYDLIFDQDEESIQEEVHYVIDTNIFILSPDILDSFTSTDFIYISHTVQEELNYRKKQDETRHAAEIAIEKINDASGNERIFYKESHKEVLPNDFSINSRNDDNDNRILSIAKYQQDNIGRNAIFLLTNDKGLQNKARSIGVGYLDLETFRTNKNITQSKNKIVSVNVSPSTASKLLLNHIKCESEKYIGNIVEKAVITVPANFSQAQVELTKKAAEEAGFIETRIMKEPIAAGLSYSIDSNDQNKKILVYDFGGGTFDATILEVSSSTLEVLGVDGDSKLGGHDITQKIKDLIYEKLEEDSGLIMFDFIDSNLSDFDYKLNEFMITKAAEEAKIDLSEFLSTNISVANLIHPNENRVNIDFELTRKEFDEEIIEIRKASIDIVKELMSSCSLEAKDIDMIVMAGGSSNIPSIYKSIKETLGKEPSINKDTSLVISEGAVIEAINIWDESNSMQHEIIYNDNALLDFGIGLKDHIFDVLIPSKTLLPHRVEKYYSTEKDNQELLEIRAFQKKNGYPNSKKTYDKGITFVDEISISNLPKSRVGDFKIKVIFELTKDDVLNMSAFILDGEGVEIESKEVAISKASEMTL